MLIVVGFSASRAGLDGHDNLGAPASRESAMPLSNSQTRYLRGLAHAQKPIVMIGGKGVTDAVIAELEHALRDHELVKVQVAIDDREQRATAADELAMRTGAEIVQRIGKVVVVYKRNADDPQIALPR
jgi:RNA-binding protein